MWVIKHRKIFFILSAVLVTASIALIVIRGLNVGIDFTGGTILEIEYVAEAVAEEVSIGPSETIATSAPMIAIEPELGVTTAADSATTTPADAELSEGEGAGSDDAISVPTVKDIEATLAEMGVTGVVVQKTGEAGFIIRSESLSEEKRRDVVDALRFGGTHSIVEKRVSSIGPTIGAELRDRAWIAIASVVLAIILFIAYVFRGVSEPVSSWKYGLIAVIALVHDIILPAGLAALLQLNVDSLFVIALLAILGLSVNDTIVVFDRVRENLRAKVSKRFDETVGKSLEQTYVRSLNTSLTTLFVVLALVILGPASTRDFAIVLAAGLAVGTYSSIFLASPLLVEVEKRQAKHGAGGTDRKKHP